MVKGSITAPLISHRFKGPWLEYFGDWPRIRALQIHVAKLEKALGPDHPNTHLARSWLGVASGAECFEEAVLEVLRTSEPHIREHFPQAHWALAMNLAAQGCHTWFLHTHAEAIPKFQEAHDIMFKHHVGCAADRVKVAEVLADGLAHGERFDEAIDVIRRVEYDYAEARKQSESIVGMFDELRQQVLELAGDSTVHELGKVCTSHRVVQTFLRGTSAALLLDCRLDPS